MMQNLIYKQREGLKTLSSFKILKYQAMWYVLVLGGERYNPFFSEEVPQMPISGRLWEFETEEEALSFYSGSN